MTTTSPRQIDSLTSLRGVLALWVVAYHFGNDLTRLFPAFRIADPLIHSGNLAVPGFFVLSGFVLAHNYAALFTRLRGRDVLAFWGLRLARIYPVHLATLLVVAAMVAVADRLGYQLTDGGYTTRDFVLNLFLVHNWVPEYRFNWNYPSWSISSEWFAYLLFPFAARGFLTRLTTPARAVAATVVCIAGTLLVYLGWNGWPFVGLAVVVPTFFAGATFFALNQVCPPRTAAGARWWPELCVVGVAAACFLPAGWNLALILLFQLALVWALVRAGDRCRGYWTARPLLYLGEVSYSLYMTHTLAQKVLYRLLPTGRYEAADPVVKVAVLLVYAAAIVAFCLGSYYLVERPCRRWFRNRLSRRKTEVALTPP